MRERYSYKNERECQEKEINKSKAERAVNKIYN